MELSRHTKHRIHIARAQIDHELRQLGINGDCDAICALKRRRNEVVPSSLPPELLGSIFLECALVEYAEDPYQMKWINVTHVCRYWREVGLNLPALWCRIAVKSHEWALAMLQRSKAMPLSIHGPLLPDRQVHI